MIDRERIGAPRNVRTAVLIATQLALLVTANAQLAESDADSTPRRPEVTVICGPSAGQNGLWATGVGNLSEESIEMQGAFLINPEDIDRVAPFRPWAKALVQYRLATLGKDDPHPRCVANAGPRQFHTPIGIEIVQDIAHQRIYILSGGGPHSWREIYMDGRSHPDPDVLDPSYFGHSIGHWEDDTLVVDTVGFNERFWFARRPTGMGHTDALHLIE